MQIMEADTGVTLYTGVTLPADSLLIHVSYRLCKKGAGSPLTEECYQRMPLPFATTTTQIEYVDGSREPFLINATTTSAGTWPPGSQWRKNPIPMCNCDIGTVSCGGKATEPKLTGDIKKFEPFADYSDHMSNCS